MVVKIWPNAKFLLPLHPILDDGVMVTLQVLVLSFPVRIRVVQLQNKNGDPEKDPHNYYLQICN